MCCVVCFPWDELFRIIVDCQERHMLEKDDDVMKQGAEGSREAR